MDFIKRNRTARYIELLQLHATAAQGDQKAITKQIAEWDKEV